MVGVHALLANGVNAAGYREILGLQVSSAEDGALVHRVAVRVRPPVPS